MIKYTYKGTVHEVSSNQTTLTTKSKYLEDDVAIEAVPKTQTKTATPTEQAQDIEPDATYDGLIKVSIGAISSTYVGSGITRQAAKTVTPTTSEQTAVASGVYTTGVIKVGAIQTETKTVTTNGDVVPTSGKYLTKVTVNVPASTFETEEISVDPTESDQVLTPTTDGYSKVTVSAIPTTYVGSGITQYTTSGNTTLNGSTTSKSFPAGYYSNAHGATHSTVNIPDPTISVNSSGLITASGSWTAGFTTDTSYSNTKQLTTKSATTITPSSSQQTAISSGTYATGDIVVSAVPTETKSVTENGTVTPTSGKYLSSVTVAIPIQHYYTGSSAPPSSLGEDGDIYLMG